MANIEYIEQLSEQQFIDNYMLKRKPFVLTGLEQSWDLSRFTPEALNRDLGEQCVQVYDNLFELQDICTLADYLDEHFCKAAGAPPSTEYVRAYSQFKEMDFIWADELFEQLKGAWQAPKCVPNRDLLLPEAASDAPLQVENHPYPFKGVFVSGRGAKTTLHRDPFDSNAVLCQAYGEKEVFLFSPDKYSALCKNGKYADVSTTDVEADYHLTLKAGEMVFFPGGWLHDVTSISDSVSITWNFIHQLQRQEFCRWLNENREKCDMDILSYLIKGGQNIADVDGVIAHFS